MNKINWENLTIDKVMSVYSGKPGCACGCRGKHTTSHKNRELAAKHRGYAYADEDVSDRTVKLIFNKVMRNYRDKIEVGTNNISVETDTRLYIIYPIMEQI